ncbi:hypothetical protein BRARA_E02701 [Brassica rapa]|uniref:Uncharacterized protein n=1 Tax=Brassica campestris TaxID=3711 RepID=A0A397ZK66_BRACM|nr:hypothetical protein BRARA_E02701 [Brassica rapa]
MSEGLRLLSSPLVLLVYSTAFRQHCELAETTKLKEINLDKLMLTCSDKVGEAEKEYREVTTATPYTVVLRKQQ